MGNKQCGCVEEDDAAVDDASAIVELTKDLNDIHKDLRRYAIQLHCEGYDMVALRGMYQHADEDAIKRMEDESGMKSGHAFKLKLALSVYRSSEFASGLGDGESHSASALGSRNSGNSSEERSHSGRASGSRDDDKAQVSPASTSRTRTRSSESRSTDSHVDFYDADIKLHKRFDGWKESRKDEIKQQALQLQHELTQHDEKRWSVREVIGSGGYSIVVRARDSIWKQVAIKGIFKKDNSAFNQQEQQAIRRESIALQRMNSEHVCKCYECYFNKEKTACFLILELIQGETLGDVIADAQKQNRPFDEHRAINVAISILSALSEIHSHGIMHRDIKPANTMLSTQTDGTTRIKVIDLGLTRVNAMSRGREQPVIARDEATGEEASTGEDDPNSDLCRQGSEGDLLSLQHTEIWSTVGRMHVCGTPHFMR
jgi:tRNA A-37 threonylcarbamoyl transferase component Bud32